jgi:hypothetical protein
MKPLSLICTLVLAVSIFVAQGLQLHSHAYAHVPDQTDHFHQGTVHFDHAVEQGEAHSDEHAPVKVANESVLKHNSFAALCGILSSSLFTYPRSLLQLPSYVALTVYRASSFDLGLAPPLRAPPV